MTIVPKAALGRNLSYTELLTAPNTGLFVALHLGDPVRVHLRRTTDRGYIETKDAPPLADPDWIYVSLAHLRESLRVIESETVDLVRMNTGVLMLRTVNSVFDTELRVYTVARVHSGFKAHTPGAEQQRVDTLWLSGLNVKPFTLTMPPVVEGSQIILATAGGTLVWETAIDPALPSSPRASFLQVLAEAGPGEFTLTEGGYYVVEVDGMVFTIAGHGSEYPLPVPVVLGAVRQTEIQADRLVHALTSALALAGDGATITLAPRHGLVTRNQYNQPVRFGLGELDPFLPFDLSLRSAKLIAEALKQAEGEDATLYRQPGAGDRFMITKGNVRIQVQGGPSSLQV
jgi:hypothetical protein